MKAAAITTQDASAGYREGRVRCITKQGFHHMAYRDWGRESAAHTAICIHGLTRNGSDFDPLATALAKTHRVVCPDLAGRGRSDWLADASDYNVLQYNMDITVLAARIGGEAFDLIGTSLGGLTGICLAGIENSPVRRLVINDVAPEIPYQALNRIVAYGGRKTEFPDLAGVEAHLRKTLAPFGPMTDDDWARMAANSVRKAGDSHRMHHDPDIFANLRQLGLFSYFDLWRQWENIKCPVLILRGKNSDFLTDRLLARMKERLPQARSIEFEGIGHAPTLNAPSQIDPLCEWLETV